MATPIVPRAELDDDLKQVLDDHLSDDEAHPHERIPAEKLLAELRERFEPHPSK